MKANWITQCKSGGILKYQKGKIIQELSKIIKSGKNNTKFFVPTEYDIAKAVNIPKENLQLMQFAKKYNYKLPVGIEKYSGESLEKIYKKLLAQHNTYGRSVSFKEGHPWEHKNVSEETIKAALLEGKHSDLSGRDSMFYNSWGQPIDIKTNEKILYLFPSTSGWKPTKIYGHYVNKWGWSIDNIYSLRPNEKFKFKPSWTTEQSYEGVLQEPLDFSGDIKTWIKKNDPPFTYSGEERANLPTKDRKFFFDDEEYYPHFDPDRYWIGPQIMRIQTKDTPQMIIKNIFKPYGNIYGITDPDDIFAPGDKEMLKGFKSTTRGFSHKRINPKLWEHADSNGNIIKSEKQGGTLKYQRGGKSLMKVLRNLSLKEVPNKVKSTSKSLLEQTYEWKPEAFSGMEYITPQHIGFDNSVYFEIPEINFTPHNVTLPILPESKVIMPKQSPNEARHNNLEKALEKFGGDKDAARNWIKSKRK